MFHITAFLLIIFGFGGVILLIRQNVRRNKIFNKLNADRDGLRENNNQDDTSQVEKLLKRTSRLVSVTTMLDKNVVAKALVVSLFVLLLYILDASAIFILEVDMMALCIIIFVIIVIFLPAAVKNSTIKRRMRNIANDFPFIIDMMAVCVQSGMTVEKSLRYIADNTQNINPDIAALFERTMMKSEVSGVGSGLEQLYEEVKNNEVRMFCSTLQQSIKYGSSVYQVLIDLSKEMRALQLLSMEEKVASLSAKMTLPMILFIMFPLLIIVAGPGIIEMVAMW